MDLVELRLASINLLLSMIGLPLHFLNQPLPGTEHSVLCIYEREEERERVREREGKWYGQFYNNW